MYVQGKLKIRRSVYGRFGSRGSKPYMVSVKSDVDLVRRTCEGLVRLARLTDLHLLTSAR